MSSATSFPLSACFLIESALALLLAVPVQAQDQSSDRLALSPAVLADEHLVDDEEEAEDEEIIVTGRPDPTRVIGHIPPENQLTRRDVRAYGAVTIADLLESLAPQTGSGRGREGSDARPIVLLNGRRISSFREVRDLPPEVIGRIDIFPEEVALKYGYRADQRVVNIVLRSRHRSTTLRAKGELPTAGGQLSNEVDLTQVMISRTARSSINLHGERSTALLESERDVRFTPTEPAEVDPRPFRTLIGSRRLARAGGNLNRTLFGDVSATLDGQLEWSDGRSLLGPALSDPGEPLRRDTESLSGHLGVALNGEKHRWRWALTGTYDRVRSISETDRESSALVLSRDRARTLSSTGELDLVLNGNLFTVPAGKASATIRLGGDTQDLDSRSRRSGVVTSADLSRDRVSSAISVDLPIVRRNGVRSVLGNLSLNLNAEHEHLSDFGGLTTAGAGITWSPVERLDLIASWTREEGAPTLNQLGDPILVTPATRVFDFIRGETVLIDVVTGGNSVLDSDRRRVMKLGGTFEPWKKLDLELRADLVHTRTDNPIAQFPGVTEAVEAAFPERFLRNADGQLVRVDLRPLNFVSEERSEFRWGFNFKKRLRSTRSSQSVSDQLRRLEREGAAPAGDAPTAATSQRSRSAGSGSSGSRRGRLQLSFYHTLLLKDQARIAPGLPKLDFLDGAPADGGIRPRHRVELEAGWSNNGLGARVQADWRSGGKVTASDETLDYSSLAVVDLRLFANLGERYALVARHPWLRGTQVRLNIDNLFDSRQEVRDAAGLVPARFQPDLLDPLGRTVSISVRKMFVPSSF